MQPFLLAIVHGSATATRDLRQRFAKAVLLFRFLGTAGKSATASGLGRSYSPTSEQRLAVLPEVLFLRRGLTEADAAGTQIDCRPGSDGKKTPQTTANFENGKAVKAEAKGPDTLEISVDTKAKVNEGDYAREGKTRAGSDGNTAQGWNHDPPAPRKWTPLGILLLATGALTIIFGTYETSDFWVDGLKWWWMQVKDGLPAVRRSSSTKHRQSRLPEGAFTTAAAQVVPEVLLFVVPAQASMIVVGLPFLHRISGTNRQSHRMPKGA